MLSSLILYVFAVLTAAGISAVAVYLAEPGAGSSFLLPSASFAVLGFVSQILSYKRPAKGAYGSAAFLPFLTVIVLAPNWIGVLAVAIAMAVGELVIGRTPIKGVFNVAQVVLGAACAVLVYTAIGGQSLLNASGASLAPLAAALPVFLIVNTAAMYGVIAIATKRSFWELIGEEKGPTIIYDLLALPFVYVFAWFYTQFGPAGAAMLAIPLLGIRELYKTNYQLERTNRELLDLMVAAIEARDPYTSGHSQRVAANSRRIAEMLGFARKESDRLYVAALLHDVGKIHDEFGPILSKPGKLTAEEFAIMKTHSAKGAELVQRVTDLQDTVLPILHHHENWDGSGYPHGISGERIPLWSRMIMFADTIDAMMSDRPYRAALSSAQVRAELIRLKGKQFDPYICEIILASPVYGQLFANVPPRDAATAPTGAHDAFPAPGPITLSA